MIPLTRLNGEHIAINPDRIERADVTPDVVLTMTDGSKYVVAETLEELIDRIRMFRASILALSQELVLRGEGGRSDALRLVSNDKFDAHPGVPNHPSVVGDHPGASGGAPPGSVPNAGTTTAKPMS